MSTEEWKPVEGFEHYEISNLGRVRKISYLRINAHSLGYPQVQLFKSDGCGKRVLGRGKQIGKKALIHRLIAMAFIPNPKNYKFLNHIDGDKSNFSLDNLEWCDHSHNMKHAYQLGLNKGTKGRKFKTINNETGRTVKKKDKTKG